MIPCAMAIRLSQLDKSSSHSGGTEMGQRSALLSRVGKSSIIKS